MSNEEDYAIIVADRKAMLRAARRVRWLDFMGIVVALITLVILGYIGWEVVT